MLHLPLSTAPQADEGEFQREMATMLKLRHPNLVLLRYTITKEEPIAVVLEYLPAGDFSDWLQAQGRSARGEDLLYILGQVAAGMTELTRQGIGMDGHLFLRLKA